MRKIDVKKTLLPFNHSVPILAGNPHLKAIPREEIYKVNKDNNLFKASKEA